MIPPRSLSRNQHPVTKWLKYYNIERDVSSAVRRAFKDGHLTSQPCLICGYAPAEAHHADYERPPLDRLSPPRPSTVTVSKEHWDEWQLTGVLPQAVLRQLNNLPSEAELEPQ